jgi:hypothetical protein
LAYQHQGALNGFTVLSGLKHLFGKPVSRDFKRAQGWQSHTVRDAMTGAKKKPGLEVISEKVDERVRVYKLPSV